MQTLKQAYQDLVAHHNEQELLSQTLKDFKTEFEEKFPEEDFAIVNRAAKLEAQQKLGQTVDKMNGFLTKVKELKD